MHGFYAVDGPASRLYRIVLRASQRASRWPPQIVIRYQAMAKDAPYIIDLCDRILSVSAIREHRFDFLRGDPGKKARNGLPLPVDAYYPSLNLVVEYCEVQHTEAVPHFDKPDKITCSGVHRGLQRALYDQRRRVILPLHGITLVALDRSEFKCKGSKRLRRIIDEDEAIIRKRLAAWAKA